MPERTAHLTLQGPDATVALARKIAPALGPGDVILLAGGIGAGKTHFARALIQSRLDRPEDVPSPTFTLVQVYDTDRGEIWHADLYRLDGPDSVIELGLTEAFDTAICLLEWPDRLGDLAPPGALSLSFSDGATVDARRVDAAWSDPRWDAVLAAVTA
ncbi:tRNA (adenosine(37)-N6)-threonylcarbamoyltransferase complex ATPase subunit type 1 TsaE [Roseivivax sp. CAU 1753]